MRILGFIGYSMICGLCLAAYTMIPGLIKYLFSIAAIIIGIRFFKSYERVGVRIGFFGAGIFFFLLFNLLYVSIAYTNNWPLPAGIVPEG